ncbi:putative hydrolase [Agromyces atrinae]|nr:zinc-dependent metalloprotease [Agromyces atrinae]NYD65599.1 putative hydrolase [Agromyces atrinae]
MADHDDSGEERSPEEELRAMLENLLSGQAGVDPTALAGAAGLPNDPASVQALFSQLQSAMAGAGTEGIDPQVALKQGRERTAAGQLSVTDDERAVYDQALHVAGLWLDEAVSVSTLGSEPRLLTRTEWLEQTMPLWIQLAEPVSSSIADSLTRALTEQAPEEMQSMVQGASRMLRGVGGTLFSMQLGQVVGQLATEVVSGGDVGIPLLDDGQAALLPQNIREFGADLDIPVDQVQLYLAVRELAHARLFRHARWLRLHLITSITEYARGISIDTERIERLAEDFDPSNTESLRNAVANGSLIATQSDAQKAALGRLETILALVEGWVDVVTSAATSRLPKAEQINETIRRRRATGGPAESAFATLVGLELRPRRLREASALWAAVTEAVGIDERDALWAHPDLLPTSEDLDDPSRLVARVSGTPSETDAADDEFDQALEALLRGDVGEAPKPEDDSTP